MRSSFTFAALFSIAALSACSPQAEQTTAKEAPASSVATVPAAGGVKLLNVSYDVARDFYKDYNPLFVAEYQKQHNNENITVQQSHGGSSKQALAVANGLAAVRLT